MSPVCTSRPGYTNLGAVFTEDADEPFLTNEAVMGQVSRNPPKQVLVGRFLSGNDVQVEPVTGGQAIGVLVSKAGTSDVVDASVALMAITGDDISARGR